MATNNNAPFRFTFVGVKPHVQLELTNTSEMLLKSVEILTVFLKDEDTPGGGPSQAHIQFESKKFMQPGEKAVFSHRTWLNGKPASVDHDQLARLEVKPDAVKPYVLDISWEDLNGKTQFQRIPIGH